MKNMGVVTEGQNYQDYMIPHTWGADEQELSQEIGGMQVEPTRPSVMEVAKALLSTPLGMGIMAIIGSILLYRGLKKTE